MRFLGSARHPAVIIAIVGMALVVGVAALHNVPTAPSEHDRDAARVMLRRAGYDNAWMSKLNLKEFEHQVKAVIAVQDAVLSASPDGTQIPMNVSREPADLLRLGKGYCYDRSRAVEKILVVLGLPVRHLAVYSTKKTGSKIVSLLTPQVASHAVSEVRTSRGWMLIDSNERWIALTEDNQPVSARQLYNGTASNARWSPLNVDNINLIFVDRFAYVVGLYSRHGRFYAPFNPIPDVNWFDFIMGNLAEM